MPEIVIPPDLLPSDGRFASGPSKVRPQAVESLAQVASTYMGTSHRKDGVRSVVANLRFGLRELFALPDDYEVVLGNGGATFFWDIAVTSLIERRSQHLSFGEFSSKFANSVSLAAKVFTWLETPQIIRSDPGTYPNPVVDTEVDFYALTQNETSTGVAMPIERPENIRQSIIAVDATSAAGGLRIDPTQFDVYYFSPQKCFGSDGGLWVAILSPLALERVERIASGDFSTARWIPPSLDLKLALDNSRQEQTYNTPALATLFLMADQVSWMNEQGGLSWAVSRCDKSASILYGWADQSPYATPFVVKPEERSHVVATIDFDPSIDAAQVAKVLRKNGILDTEPYRKLGRNQLRIAMFPAIEPDDIKQVCSCIDYVVQALSSKPYRR
ncbi:MAG: phosphoserine transaminase [Actinobacteria bacterium]|nr:phosphoserine transaminase [Actinomycetota bacterium]MCL6105126.1 phosphoserine transaminase [Actinomycetota bacterium]